MSCIRVLRLGALVSLALGGGLACAAQKTATAPSTKPSPVSILAEPVARQVPKPKELPKLLQEVESKYTQAATLMAKFSQVNEMAALKRTKTSSGVILFKLPGKVRWETLKPDQNLLVSDGRTFWFYTPPPAFDETEHGQLIETRSQQFQSRLLHALLSGAFSMAAQGTMGMGIREKSATDFILTPKKGSAGTVAQAGIHIDPEKKLITEVTLNHVGGNSSVITLTEIELGKPLDDGLFLFTAPPGTERVKQ